MIKACRLPPLFCIVDRPENKASHDCMHSWPVACIVWMESQGTNLSSQQISWNTKLLAKKNWQVSLCWRSGKTSWRTTFVWQKWNWLFRLQQQQQLTGSKDNFHVTMWSAHCQGHCYTLPGGVCCNIQGWRTSLIHMHACWKVPSNKLNSPDRAVL